MVTGVCRGCGRRRILVAVGKSYFVREHKPCGRHQKPRPATTELL